MEKLGSGLKKVLLAGIGAVAVTGEKSKELLDEMVKKGELTVEQGKALNEELKHNIKSTVKEKVNVKVKTSSPEELDELLDKMTPEQMALLKQRIDEMEKKQEEFEAAETVEDAAEEAAEEETSRPALAQAWRPFMDYNPDNGILAMVTQLGETLEIYNLKDSTHLVLYGPNGEPEFKTARDGSGVPDGIMGFNDIKVTDKYIYAVFQGIKFKDKLAAYQRGERLEDGGRFIYVFDLQGNPVQKYTLDHAIYGIDVNEETNTIVATEVKSDDPIIEFKI